MINNKMVEEKEAMVNIFSDAVMYGAGVFETMRTTKHRIVFGLEDHLERLFSSANQIELPLRYSIDEVRKMILSVVHHSDCDLQRLKIAATPDDCIVISSKLEPDPQVLKGVKLMSVVQRRSLPSVKSLSYLECYLSYNKARKNGFFEALLINENQEVYEGSRSNLFWLSNGTLHTRKHDVLPGITRKTIIDISPFPVEYQTITLEELKTKEEVFQTGSVSGIVPIIQIDDIAIGSGEPGMQTQNLIQLYDKLLDE